MTNENNRLSSLIYSRRAESESVTLNITYPQKVTYTFQKQDLETAETAKFIHNLKNGFLSNITKAQIKFENSDRIQRISNLCAVAFGATTVANYLLGTSNASVLAFGVATTALTTTLSLVEAYNKHSCQEIQHENHENIVKLDNFIAQNR